MRFNLHGVDRAFRSVIGLAIVALSVSYQTGLVWLGMAVTISGLVGFCPVYAIARINTRQRFTRMARTKTPSGRVRPAH